MRLRRVRTPIATRITRLVVPVRVVGQSGETEQQFPLVVVVEPLDEPGWESHFRKDCRHKAHLQTGGGALEAHISEGTHDLVD